MQIIASEINSEYISLVTDFTMARLVLSYGDKLKNTYEDTVNNDRHTITKDSLGLPSLENIYFRLEAYDENDNKVGVGLYEINVINNIESKIYQADRLKQELDNLNYYDGVLESLNNKLRFLEANDIFLNYLNFLEKDLNGNNFIRNIKQ